MALSLSPDLEQLITEKVKNGHYASSQDVIFRALQLLNEYDELQRIRLGALRADIQTGLDELERGETLDGSSVMDEILTRHAVQYGSQA